MLEILKDTDRRLVLMLGARRSARSKWILDKDAGFLWIERRRRFWLDRTLTIPLAEVAGIDTQASGRREILVLTTASRAQHRFAVEAGCARTATRRMRDFTGLQDAPPLVVQKVQQMPRWGTRGTQAVAAAGVCVVAVWAVAQAGGLVADAAAKAGGLFVRGAERIQNRLLLPACDAAESRDAIQELVRDRLGSSAVLSDIAQRGQSGDERFCNATARRGTQTASISYRNYWDGWTPKVRLTGEIVALKLDAARMTTVDEAIQTFLASSGSSHRTGTVPRQTDQAIDKALAVIFGASDLAAEPLAPTEIDQALGWLKAADRVGAIYLLAGTGYDDFAKVPQSAALQRRMRGNVIAFADEFGRYADFQMVLLAAVANAQMRAAGTASTPAKARASTANADETRAQLTQAMKSGFIALVYDGHNDGWRMARLTALGRTAPVAAKFLSKDDAKALRDLALQTVDYFKDPTVRAKTRDVAALLSAP